MSTSTTEADFSLADLQEGGVQSLQSQTATPGTTYEVAPDIVGTLSWPTLQTREEAQEIRSGLLGLFKEDARPEQFEALSEASRDGSELGAEESPIREGVTVQEFTQTTARVNCRLTAHVLDFDEQQVKPSDIVPEMAAVVSHHFTNLAVGSNGQKTS